MAKKYYYKIQKRNRNNSPIVAAAIILVLGAVIFFAVNAEPANADPEQNTNTPAPAQSVTEENPGENNPASPAPAPGQPSAPPAQEVDADPLETPDIPDDVGTDDLPHEAEAPVEPHAPPDTDDPFFEASMPILVNPQNFIPEGYDPDLVAIGNGFYLNRRAAAAWHAMQAAASRDGISLWVISAYRSHETQTRNFNNLMQQHMNAGRSREEAHALTAAYIAVPGTSEHTLGLAIDVNVLSVSFENSPEFAWLVENGADFGFILRYPRDTTHITGINYEPWHFRYVGSNHARIIMDRGIVLEEYLEMYG